MSTYSKLWFEFFIDLLFLNTIFFTLCGRAYLSVMDEDYIFHDLIARWIDTEVFKPKPIWVKRFFCILFFLVVDIFCFPEMKL